MLLHILKRNNFYYVFQVLFAEQATIIILILMKLLVIYPTYKDARHLDDRWATPTTQIWSDPDPGTGQLTPEAVFKLKSDSWYIV